MTDLIEVHIDFVAGARRVGTLRRYARQGRETATFEYHPDWLADGARFSLEPALTLDAGPFAPAGSRALFGSIGDSAPDTWGRRLMQRGERRRAEREGRAVRTLMESDYLLGVTDVSRLGALRFRREDDPVFQAPSESGVPTLVALGRLLEITERIARDEETDEDLRLIFAPGSSLGGARPKASVIDARGRLAIAKFPKQTDEHSLERWEWIANRLASRAGIRTAEVELLDVGGAPVFLSRRFDRMGEVRVPFLSALSMLGLTDGEEASYPELVDALGAHGAEARADAEELYRRMVFNVLISNVDDHLRNHGFLWSGGAGWRLSPAYDLNPTPPDLRARVLTTRISLEDGTCDLELALSVAGYFGLASDDARRIAREVAHVTVGWSELAASVGVTPAERRRMAGAFEHADLTRALAG